MRRLLAVDGNLIAHFPYFISPDTLTTVSKAMVMYPVMVTCLSAENLFYHSKRTTCMYCELSWGPWMTSNISSFSRIFIIDKLVVICRHVLYLIFEFQV